MALMINPNLPGQPIIVPDETVEGHQAFGWVEAVAVPKPEPEPELEPDVDSTEPTKE